MSLDRFSIKAVVCPPKKTLQSLQKNAFLSLNTLNFDENTCWSCKGISTAYWWWQPSSDPPTLCSIATICVYSPDHYKQKLCLWLTLPDVIGKEGLIESSTSCHCNSQQDRLVLPPARPFKTFM